MGAISVRKRLTKWGNGYGIRLTKAEAQRLGVQPGDTLDAELALPAGPMTSNDLDQFVMFDSTGDSAWPHHDELIGDDLLDDLGYKLPDSPR